MIRSSNHTRASWRQLSTHHTRHCLLTSPKCDAYVFDLLLACNFHRHGSPISCSLSQVTCYHYHTIFSSPTEEVPVTTSPCSWSSIRFGQRQWGYSPVSPRQNYPSEAVANSSEAGYIRLILHPTDLYGRITEAGDLIAVDNVQRRLQAVSGPLSCYGNYGTIVDGSPLMTLMQKI